MLYPKNQKKIQSFTSKYLIEFLFVVNLIFITINAVLDIGLYLENKIYQDMGNVFLYNVPYIFTSLNVLVFCIYVFELKNSFQEINSILTVFERLHENYYILLWNNYIGDKKWVFLYNLLYFSLLFRNEPLWILNPMNF